MSNCDLVAARSLIDLAVSRLALRTPRYARLRPRLDQIDQRSSYRAVGTVCRPL